MQQLTRSLINADGSQHSMLIPSNAAILSVRYWFDENLLVTILADEEQDIVKRVFKVFVIGEHVPHGWQFRGAAFNDPGDPLEGFYLFEHAHEPPVYVEDLVAV